MYDFLLLGWICDDRAFFLRLMYCKCKEKRKIAKLSGRSCYQCCQKNSISCGYCWKLVKISLSFSFWFSGIPQICISFFISRVPFQYHVIDGRVFLNFVNMDKKEHGFYCYSKVTKNYFLYLAFH